MDNEVRPDFEDDPEFVSEIDPEVLQQFIAEHDEKHPQPEPTLEVEDEPLEDAFPDAMYEDLVGLTWLGFLTKSFRFAGHEFVIRTITVGEELAISQIVQDYANTLGDAKAYSAGIAAACIETVDGLPLIDQLGPNVTIGIRDKFAKICDPDTGWYWSTVEAVFNHYADLQIRQQEVIDRLESKS